MTISEIVGTISNYISGPYLACVVLLCGATKQIIAKGLSVTFPGLSRPTVYSVFLVATILAVIFRVVFNEGLLKLFVTYAVATSLYDVLYEGIRDVIKKQLLKTEKNDDNE
jgi:mannose/fructose/N-acetylgalactosamine-specific phosphotransferase system component IIC